MDSFSTIAFTLAGFLTLYAFVFFYVGYNEPKDGRDKSALRARFILFLFGFIYIGLSHFAVLSALGYGVELTTRAPCENVVVNSTTSDNVTYEYAYNDSCADRETPLSAQRLYTVFTYLLYTIGLSILIGTMYLIFNLLRKW